MSLPRLAYDPREERDAKSSPSIEWVPDLGCWCAFDTGAITAILKSSDFAAADFAAWHLSLGRMGIDCSSVIEILNHIATANEGPRHAEIRKNMARVIGATAASAKKVLDEKIATLVPLLCCNGARVDLVRELIQPVCDQLFELLLGMPTKSEDGISSSQIFDLYLSLNRRKEVVAKASAMLETYSAERAGLTTTPEYATALRMLGYDSIVGSLGMSMLHVFGKGCGERLCDVSYPQDLPKTGVPYVERFAARDCRIGETIINKGDRIRLFLDPGAQRNHTNNGECYFGKGRHSCLGEDLSNWLWRSLTRELARLPFRVIVESKVRRKPDWVFIYYSSIVVRFHV